MICLLGEIGVFATKHCNNKCVSCVSASPIMDPYFVNLETVKNDLSLLSKVMTAKTTSITGGEPLLHPKIIDLLDIVANSKLNAKFHFLYTNGLLLPKMKNKFWETLAKNNYEINLSVYPNLPDDAIIDIINKSRKYKVSVSLRNGSWVNWIKILKDSPKGESYFNCTGNRCTVVDEGYLYLCPESAIFPALFGKDMSRNIDGLELKTMTQDSLKAFLTKSDPLITCRICGGSSSDKMEWKQVNKKDWIKESIGEIKNDMS